MRAWLMPGILTVIAALLVLLLGWSVFVAEPTEIPWSELVPAIVGGVMGALAGGIPAYFIARAGSREVLARDRAARQEQQRAIAFRAHVRVGIIVNAVLSLQRQLEEMMPAGDAPAQVQQHPWLVVRSIAGVGSETLSVDPEEAAIFAAAGQADYVNDLLLLPRRYVAIASALDEYARRRAALTAQMPVAFFEGEMGSSFLDTETVRKLMPQMIELNSLIAQARAMLALDAATATALARRFGPIMKEHFKDPTFPGFNLDEVPTGNA